MKSLEPISGIIVKGVQDPKKGFPTANINVPVDLGVYTCVTNFGNGLGICIRENELEVHIIGFNRDIYGQMLEVSEMKEVDKKLFLAIGLIINGHLTSEG